MLNIDKGNIIIDNDIMTRLLLSKDDQIEFFKQIKIISKKTSNDLGALVGISGRSYRDWANGKTLPKNNSIQLLSAQFHIKLPPIIATREENWSGTVYGSKAAKAWVMKYGSPGNQKSRKLGGQRSQLNRKLSPVYYRQLGCNVANDFIEPKDKALFSEFIGIVLGDGGLTKTQCHITLHLFDDEAYSLHVKSMIYKLFSYQSSIGLRWKYTGRELTISGVNFIKLLEKNGLQTGDKVKNQVGIPSWIKSNDVWFASCIRGLFDTDGGTFTHKHIVNSKEYVNFGISFTSGSVNLREDFKLFLKLHDIKFGENKLNILVYNKPGISRFFSIVSPSNQKHVVRFHEFLG